MISSFSLCCKRCFGIIEFNFRFHAVDPKGVYYIWWLGRRRDDKKTAFRAKPQPCYIPSGLQLQCLSWRGRADTQCYVPSRADTHFGKSRAGVEVRLCAECSLEFKKITHLKWHKKRQHKREYEKATHRQGECVVDGAGGGVGGAGQVGHDGLDWRNQDPWHPTWPVRPSAPLCQVLHSHLIFHCRIYLMLGSRVKPLWSWVALNWWGSRSRGWRRRCPSCRRWSGSWSAWSRSRQPSHRCGPSAPRAHQSQSIGWIKF